MVAVILQCFLEQPLCSFVVIVDYAASPRCRIVTQPRIDLLFVEPETPTYLHRRYLPLTHFAQHSLRSQSEVLGYFLSGKQLDHFRLLC